MYELMSLMFVIALVVNGFRYAPYAVRYYMSDYRNESGVGLFKFLFDAGCTGEGLTFMELEKISDYSRILTNVYLPTERGTTELDVVYIIASGIYVLESKNYSVWIFGNVKQKMWTQILYKRKYRFYNPIWQNRTHVKYLKKALGDVAVKSIIVFSKGCTLKKVLPENSRVIKRDQLRNEIRKNSNNVVYSKEEIDDFYKHLKYYSNQSERVKNAHIKNVKGYQ